MGKKITLTNLIGIITYIVAIVLTYFIVKTVFSGDVWYDETFSLMFARGKWGDIVRMTARDVHPPLYYIYLKLCITLFGSIGAVEAAKLASVLLLLGIHVISLTYVRKRLGIVAMGMFSLVMTFMPQLATYYVEIRMYSFAMLLITGSFCLFIELTDENAPVWRWIVFWTLGMATAYTQYFACVAIIAIYLMLIVNGITRKLGKKYIRRWLICVVASIVAYCPWLLILKQQLSNVATSYWIQPMTWRSIPGCVKFIFLPVSGEGKIVYVATAAMLMTVVIAYILFLVRKPAIGELMIAFCGPAALGMIVIVGYVFSVAGHPLFTYRYMVPALGAMYLGIVYVIIKCDKRWIFILAVLAFSFGGYYSIKNFYYDENTKSSHYAEAMQRLEEVEQNSIIITNFDHVTTISTYYRPDAKVYIYEGEVDSIIKDIFGGCEFVNDQQVYELAKNNENVYFFGSFVSRDEIVEDWKEIGVKSEYINECMIERYWFNIYRLDLDE